MADRRTYGSYNDGCAAAHALDLVGERWTMIVVRELLLGPKRFADLQRDIPGIGPTVLTRRLANMVAGGIASKRRVEGATRIEVYELTTWGQRLENVNNALAMWAVDSPDLPWTADMSPDTLILSMRAHARPCPHADDGFVVAIKLTDSRHEPAREPVTYRATITPLGTTIERARASHPDATLTTTTRALKAAVLTGASLPQPPRGRIDGSAEAIDCLLDATRLSRPTS